MREVQEVKTMILTSLTKDFSLVISWAGNTITIDNPIGVIGLVIGAILTGVRGSISFLAIISSYNIEIALMTKKEQWKFVISNLSMLAVSICFLNVICCYWCRMQETIDVFIAVGAISFLYLICVLLYMVGRWIINKLKTGFFFRIIRLIKNRKKKQRALYRVRGKVIHWNGAKEKQRSKNNFIIKLQEEWKTYRLEKNNSKPQGKVETFKVLAFIAVFILGISLNCYFDILGSVYNIWAGSVVMTLLTMEVLVYLVNFGNQSGISRIWYYDTETQKDIFIFFRYDSKCCICGDTARLTECNEYYLIPYKKVQSQKLMPVSKRIKNDLHINHKRVMMQTANGDFELEKVLDKVKEKLKDQNITQNKLDETRIYIKPSDKKAYYVAPDKVTGSVEL